MDARCAHASSFAPAKALAEVLAWVLGLALMLALVLPAPAHAQGRAADKRIALVIGNAQYPKVPLANPENDARLMAANLRRLGFEVNLQLNVNVLLFRRALRDFARQVAQDDATAVLYYAGHGVQIDGRNYLLPVDINLRDQEEVKDESVDIDELFLSRIDKAGSHPRIVILDACRDNPFAAKTRNVRSAGGLAEMGARGTLIAFASAPGAPAEDGPGGSNSVYTKALAEEIMVPGLEVEQMFKNVRVKVLRATRERQLPWVNTSLTSNFSFNPNTSPAAAAAPPAAAAAPPLAAGPAPGAGATPGRDSRPKDIDTLLSQAQAQSRYQSQAPSQAPAQPQPQPRPQREREAQIAATLPSAAQAPPPAAAPLPPASPPASPPQSLAPSSSRDFLARDELQQLLVGKTHGVKDGGGLVQLDLRSGGTVYFHSLGAGNVSVRGSGRYEFKDDGSLCARFNPAPPGRLSDARSPDSGCWYFYRDGDRLMRTQTREAQARAEPVTIQ
ncbi:caspase family protein [Variovorax sp. KK3]|uniref:caspase family protein n=1 Tax=Variovorax sp. KK3 TaxID=1855728 RepID=UPI00097BC2ED|nr:caspase family protein [Variovorax sp. KK3]